MTDGEVLNTDSRDVTDRETEPNGSALAAKDF